MVTTDQENLANHIAAHHAALSPMARATALAKASEELDGLVEILRAANEQVADDAVEAIRVDLKSLESLTAASLMAASDLFSGEPLTGVGSEEWLLLYKSARAYSEHVAYLTIASRKTSSSIDLSHVFLTRS